MNSALLIVDTQNDFCPGGALAVPEGDRVVPVINQLTGKFRNIILTQDWHPAGHHSFASSHSTKEPFDEMTMDYGRQILWPDHCIQGTKGAQFHPDLNVESGQLIIRKGFRKEIDSYSGFFENDHKTATGLAGYLKERDVETLYIAGLAADFCVKWTVLDARKLGFQVHVVTDAVQGLDVNGSLDQAWDEMSASGAQFIESKQLLA